MSMVQQAVEISAPLHAVYEQLATFENYPRFMTGVEQVIPVGEGRTHWVMDVEGRRQEFDARIVECSLDERVAWATVDGPRMAETITLRPMGETRTQIVAQLEADAAFLLPGDRHGEDALSRRLKADLTTFKGLIETGKLGTGGHLSGASSKNLTGSAYASPASVAGRARGGRPGPGAGWGTSAGEFSNAHDDGLGTLRPNAGTAALGTPNAGTTVDITSAPGIRSAHDLDDVLAPGRRIVGAPSVRGGAAGTRPAGQSSAAARMGGKAMGARDGRGDGVIHEEERGSW
ncbi:SRPBCC family protein [Pseudosporangium ferrugineum]|uniref:Polyketide cyclase/dehydrase/lipid transport protein n=1 Tax=Pseudosporangium ferrugineum TaxID=439699 RepID=A0A2T0S602_9ACTN|nr:SRPBCC family protein [Pseudosporangium ferrugineum]PRY28703.1 polyketide cyclase/dehydrase/lipid transport protein [Pseudosporangium ferrugineum]